MHGEEGVGRPSLMIAGGQAQSRGPSFESLQIRAPDSRVGMKHASVLTACIQTTL